MLKRACRIVPAALPGPLILTTQKRYKTEHIQEQKSRYTGKRNSRYTCDHRECQAAKSQRQLSTCRKLSQDYHTWPAETPKRLTTLMDVWSTIYNAHFHLACTCPVFMFPRYEIPWTISFPPLGSVAVYNDGRQIYDGLYFAGDSFISELVKDPETITENPWEANL